MMETNQGFLRMLKYLSAVFVLMAVATVIPGKSVHGSSIMGYASLCPFAPFSTGISLYAAYMIRRYLDRVSKQSL